MGFTYHVVPRFDIAALGGQLFLGAIFRDLELKQAALNRLQTNRIFIRQELRYTPVALTGFRETYSKVREGKFEAWVKVLSGTLTGSINASGSSDNENTISCDKVWTVYFDPDDTYLSDCFGVEPIQKYLEGSRSWTAELYLITGLKVATKLEFNKSNTSQGQFGGHFAAQDPVGGIAAFGVDANLGRKDQHQLEFGVEDIVVGYRVNKYRCVRRISGKTRGVKDDGVVEGEMMAQEEAETAHYTQIDAFPIPEEVGEDAQENWVIPVRYKHLF